MRRRQSSRTSTAPSAAQLLLAAVPTAPALDVQPELPTRHVPGSSSSNGRRYRLERYVEAQARPRAAHEPWNVGAKLGMILQKPVSTPAQAASGTKLERSLARRGQNEQSCDFDIAKNLEAIGHLTEELDGLFAVMGRLTVVARVGQRCALQLATGTPRTVEVKLPKAQEEGRDLAVQVECSYDGKFHVPEPGPHRQNMLPEFDLSVADTQRQASAGGPYRAQSSRKSVHRLHLATDCSSIFVTLCARKDCHVELLCRASQGGNIADTASSDGSEDSDSARHRSTGVSKGLQAKLQLRRQELLGVAAAAAKPAPAGAGAGAAASGSSAVAPGTAARAGPRARGFGDFVFQGSKAPRSPEEVQDAQQRVLRLWLGSAKSSRRAKGQWVKSLSAECPRKLLRWLRREAQERRCLQTVAVAGAFAFLLKRQRELHVMRTRTALRQLMWYKALFAASRLRLAVAFAARGREAAREAVAAASGKRRGQQAPNRRSIDVSLPLAERVRRCADSFGDAARQHIGTQASPSGGPPALSPGKSQSLEEHLAAQGFTLNPRGAPSRRSSGKSQKTTPRDVPESLGREVQPDVAASTAAAAPAGEREAADRQTTEAADEVSSRMLQVCSPRAASQASPRHFKRHSQFLSLSNSHELPRKRPSQAESESGTSSGVVKITKRYLLKFFDDEPRDLPWLPMLQSLMLVIHGHAAFQTAWERHAVDENLRFFKEARRQALRKPGAFAPLEAALWSHPVILQLAMRLQRSTLHGDSATAWKGSVFEGCYAASSGRDATGASLTTGAPVGGGSQLMLRRLVDVSGQFELGTGIASPLPSVELTPNNPGCIATKTTSGHPIRAFGEKHGLEVHSMMQRRSDQALEMPPDAGEQSLRLEALRLQRREREFASWDSGKSRAQLLADSELKAQQRYGGWMLGTEVPPAAQAFKEKLKPYFESFASADLFASSSSSSQGPKVLQSASLECEETLQAAEPVRSIGNAGPSPGRLPGVGGSPLPQSLEEVGRLVERSDALRTILGMDKAEHGGFAHRCPAGWNSGYREEPMSKEEIRRARIVEKCLAPRRQASHSAR